MVFVAWQQRFDAFARHYNEMNFQTIGQAIVEKEGWTAIANQPDWGFFKFSHTDPGSSNSGLMSLVLMSYDYRAKHAGLDNTDILDSKFQDWLRTIERNLVGARSGLSDSTGNLMTSMVQRGWSTYDVIFVYESVAIDYLQRANGRYGPLKVVYPKYNMWNDNPYYVLDVPWSSPEQRKAAKMFLDFLLGEDAQRQAMTHGFRPANTNVPTNGPDSPFAKYPNLGIRPDVPGIFCEPPKAEVMESLLLAWQRSQAELH
jgi:ABC-type Fe3+ transport system substrate-binding protein